MFQLIIQFSLIVFTASKLLYPIGGTPNISLGLTQMLNDFKQNTDYQIGKYSMSKLKTKVVKVDYNNSLKIHTADLNGEISSGAMNLLYINRNGKILNDHEYNFAKTKYDEIIESEYGYESGATNLQSQNKIVDCNLYYSPMISNFSVKTDDYLKTIKKIGRVGTISVALLQNNTIVYLNYDDNINNEGKFKKMIDFFFTGIKVDDFWVINQSNLFTSFLVVLTDETLNFYEINPSKDPSLPIFNRTIETSNLPFSLNDEAIINFDFYNNKMIYGTSKGIYKDTKKIIIETVKDFIVVSSNIYVITGEGLNVYNLSSDIGPKLLYKHKNLMQIDFFQNPFSGNSFIGVSIKQEYDGEEFFVEFLLTKNNLLVNKIFTYIKKSFLPFYTLDNFHTYFYAEIYNRLFIIRRGMLNAAYFVTYNYKFTDIESKQITKLTSVFQNELGRHRIAFLNNSNLMVMHGSDFPKQRLNCTFLDSNKFFLGFNQTIDVCNPSFKEKPDILSVCKRIIDLKFEVQESAKIKEIKIALITAYCVGLGILGIVVLILAKTTKCFRVNTLRVIPGVGKNNVHELYQEIEPTISSREFNMKKSHNYKQHLKKMSAKKSMTSRELIHQSSSRKNEHFEKSNNEDNFFNERYMNNQDRFEEYGDVIDAYPVDVKKSNKSIKPRK